MSVSPGCPGTSEIPEPLSVHDLLLLGEPVVSCVVRKGSQEVVRHQAAVGQMIIWAFSTLKYDIAFSIEVNGQTKLSYTCLLYTSDAADE